MACCHDDHCAADAPPNSAGWRRALWIALVINAGFFLAEIIAGVAAGSAALQADALDFFGDAANYAISLGVAGMALTWRARAAVAKGGTLIAFALWVLGSTVWHAVHGTLPQAEMMGMIGLAALLANGGVAFMLYRFRGGDANMRSVWICSRNDAIGNFAVLLAALGVFGSGTGWPDVIVASIMGGLGLWGGLQIVRQRGVNCAANMPHRSAWRRSRKLVAETPSAPPITCCLSAGAYRNRIAWIESLTRRALQSHARDDLVLRLAYAPEAAADVRKMVEQERICCAFLTFDLKEEADCIRVTITVPQAARDSANMLFGHFLATRSAAPGLMIVVHAFPKCLSGLERASV